jgi:endonuclease/exonuclease/phosphatase family metal-dependent hydrolase
MRYRFVTIVLALMAMLGRPAVAQDTDKTLTFATYNIHHGEGTDGKLDLERIAKLVQPADIIALQEVDRHFGPRSQYVDQAQWLAERLGYHYAYAANLDFDAEGDRMERRQYGVALLSRFPIESNSNHLLPKRSGSEQRGLLETVVPSGQLRVYVTHLSHNSQPERLMQVERIQEILAASNAKPDAVPRWMMAGDFNFRPDSKEYQRLTEQTPQEGDPMLHPVDAWLAKGEGGGASIGSGGPRPGRIDYIWLSPDLEGKLKAIWVEESNASDHLPVFATIDL